MAQAEGGRALYGFGPFVLDGGRRVLTRDGAVVALRPTVFDTLLFLVEHPGRVVTKEELFDAVWPGKVVEESNITQTIFMLRNALGEQHGIVTAPGQGYRFTAPVTSKRRGLLAQLRNAAAAFGRRGPALQIGVAVGAALAVIVTGVAVFRPWGNGAVEPGGLVVVADFQNSTGNPVFDKTLAAATAIDLRQSPHLTVLSPDKIQDTLDLMTRPKDSPLPPEVAREVCARNNGQESIEGGISQIGGQFLLTLTATGCGDGRVIASDKAVVDTASGLLPALDAMADRLRRNLGETGASVRAFNVPLLGRKTASLDALKAYSEATYLADHGRRMESIPLYQRAIELDPNFAMAYADLSFAYDSLHDHSSAVDLITKAYAMRDRAGQYDQFAIATRYQILVNQDDIAAIRALKAWSDIYPDDAEPRTTLASEEEWLGRVPEAIADGQRSLAMASDKERPYEILTRAYMMANQADKAKAVCALAIARHVDGERTHKRLFEIAVWQYDPPGMQRELQWFAGKPAERIVLIDAAQAAVSEGHVRQASALFARAVDIGKDSGLSNYIAAPYARLLSDLGFTEEARRNLDQVPKDQDFDDYRVAMVQVGEVAPAEALLRELLAKSPSDTLLNGKSGPETRAALALRKGRPVEAIEDLKPATPYELTDFSVPYLRGQAFLATSDGPHAAAEFHKILDNRGVEPLSVHYPLAELGLARALRLQGDVPASRQAYARFLAGWKDADQDIPVLRQARAEYAKL
ncbi:MAG TPA: winged helix-turn-helix domain-containing protein [Caulobacteraceae bacterium]|nr:winged helix-turn-helix domain-containing protein [Caulobacteraceae bacterium]